MRAASDRFISGCYDAQDDGVEGDGESDVICLDDEDVADSERRKLAMSPRAPATKIEAHAEKKDNEDEESDEGDEAIGDEDQEKDEESSAEGSD